MELHNWHIALIGWFVWNVGLFSFKKDEYDDAGKAFFIKAYVMEHWDNWLFSLVAIPALLIIGTQELDMDALAVIDLGKWSNLYYLGSGFFAESSKEAYKKWRKKKQAE